MLYNYMNINFNHSRVPYSGNFRGGGQHFLVEFLSMNILATNDHLYL